METDEQTPKKQNKKTLHSHKKQYLIYNIIKTKKMLSKKTLSAQRLCLLKLIRNTWNFVPRMVYLEYLYSHFTAVF